MGQSWVDNLQSVSIIILGIGLIIHVLTGRHK
jgi:hypothetical protein